jgi:7,8-dihydropterin-6-yl-methyl-4-(beta-D-ribofuranosyl)aminobenzene 5'-phosphate synthase
MGNAPRTPGSDLYICGGFNGGLKNKARSYGCNITEVDSFAQITDNIYTTGQMEAACGFYRIAEQSLVLDTDKGLTIITGCAHPGIIDIVEYVMERTQKEIHAVIGGFHLLDNHVTQIKYTINAFKALGVRYVGPSHCTGEIAERLFQEAYRKNFIDIRRG